MNVGEITYYNHSSKVRSVFVDNKELPLISIDIWCKAGCSFEQFKKNGTAHFLEHMIFKGNNRIMPGEFDYVIESLGGFSNASTGYDDVHYHVLVPPHNFKESLALLTNIVFSPSFDEREFKKEKGVVIDEIKQQNDQPDERLFNYFLKRVWQNNYYSKPILGEENDIKFLEINDLKEFHNQNYFKENVSIAIAGNLSSNIYKLFEEFELSEINAKSTLNISRPTNPKLNKTNFSARTGREKVFFDDLEFSRIFMAWRIPSLNDQKKIIGFEILASILSVGRNSKFNKALREEKNLVESIFVDVNSGELGGLFIIEACCNKEDLNLVEKLINEIIDEILNYKILTFEEVTKAVNIVKSNYVFNLETATQLSSFFGNELLWGRKNSLKNLEKNLEYWNNLNNFREIINLFSKENFTLIASTN